MLKIILTGPESCGKTTLARQLAKHFGVPLVEEYVREYFQKKQTSQYEEADLKEIAMGQIAAEKKAESALFKQLTRKNHTKKPPFFICDTDILTIKIWAEEKYGRCDEWILKQFQISKVIARHEATRFKISDSADLPSNFNSHCAARSNQTLHSVNNLCKDEDDRNEGDRNEDDRNEDDRNEDDRKGRPYEYPCRSSVCRGDLYGRPDVCTDYLQKQTLYLLCSPEGIAWEVDPLRENPNDRERLFEVYEKELIFYEKSYKILRGGIFERFEEVQQFLLGL